MESSGDSGIIYAILGLVGLMFTGLTSIIVARINNPKRESVTTTRVNDELVIELAELLVEERERNQRREDNG